MLKQVFARAVQQVVDREDAALFEAIGRADGQADFGRAHLELVLHVLRLLVGTVQRNARHGGFPPFVKCEM